MSNRRDNRRVPRRLQVQFWKRGEVQANSGYTINVSPTGMFIGTNTPLPSGTRIRVEVFDEEHGFVVEGMVAHAAKVSPLLHTLRPSGMGVRFLTGSELIAPLMRAQHGASSSAEVEIMDGVCPVAFGSPDEFLEVWERDLRNGGLFIQTEHPAPLDLQLEVELVVPGAEGQALRFPARVVQRVPAGEGSPAGMAVAFADPGSVVSTLQPLAQRLQG